MANNRLYLKCTLCSEKFYMAKYYPSSGWYTNLKGERDRDYEEILEWFISFQIFIENHSPYIRRGSDGNFTLDMTAEHSVHGNASIQQINIGDVFLLEYESN